ncbi:E3 ubiquitin-protein ligase tom1, partial [Spiromyces aspiralis]
MAKIKKKVQRRANYPPHEIRELKHALEKGTERDIIENVARLEEWKFVRGDFYHWVPTLDRFDEILERVCTEYELKSLQRRPFAPETAQLVKAILDFTLLLLENCVNRNLYSSIDRLEQLINTTDIEVLEKVLCVLLRGFQRWNAQRDQRSMYQAFLPKLKCLSQPWYVTKYMRWNDVQGEIDISKQGEVYQMLFRAGNLSFHSDATSITYQYYRTPFDAEAGSAGTTHQQPGVVSEDQHQHQGGSAETPRHRLLRGAKQASG